jgi:hypothetical protein
MTEETNLKSCVLMSIFLLGIICVTAAGRTIYVDDDGPADFNTIQAAIDDSNDGDTIIVADGIYTGDGNRDIEFSHGLPEGQTRAITVRSANGPGNCCIIDCNGSLAEKHRGFRFISGEDANSVISGFTITNGFARWEATIPPPFDDSDLLGGAIHCSWDSNPTISNCVISGNFGNYGGGISCFVSNPTIINCTVTGNWAFTAGGGIWNNSYNTTKVTNCIIWGNSDSGGTDESAQIYGITAVVNYCCIQGLTGALGGIGNIGDDPCFVEPGYWEDPCNTPTMPFDDIWVDGDYHLKSQAGRWEPNSESWVQDSNTSPCIDAGDPVSSIGNEPFPNGGRINMGAYGGTVEASKSYFGGPVCEIIVAGDVNGDCIVNNKDFALMALNWLRDENQ